jgi:hypothetical protein
MGVAFCSATRPHRSTAPPQIGADNQTESGVRSDRTEARVDEAGVGVAYALWLSAPGFFGPADAVHTPPVNGEVWPQLVLPASAANRRRPQTLCATPRPIDSCVPPHLSYVLRGDASVRRFVRIELRIHLRVCRFVKGRRRRYTRPRQLLLVKRSRI